MVTIPGASGYLSAATLANRQGISAGQATVLGDGGIGAVDILDIGRSNRVDGIGLSRNARFLNKQFLASTTANFNAIFSLGLGATATIEGLQQEILALRAGTPTSKLARSLVQVVDSGGVSESETGQEVDTEA
ncbi:MAG: hypothetical protein R3E13_02300 [Alphaproteobacteria bacterium]